MRLTSTKKIVLLVVMILIASLVQLIIQLNSLYDDLMDQKKIQTKNIVDSANGIAKRYISQAKSGKYSMDEARKKAFEAIGGMIFEGTNYVFIIDYDNRILVHPDPKLYKKDMSQVKGLDGKVFVPLLVKEAKAGGGFVDYVWKRDGKRAPKTSYSIDIPEFNVIVGTGIYIDDVDKIYASERNSAIFVFIIILILSGGFAFFIGWGIKKSLDKLKESSLDIIDSIEEGKLDKRVDINGVNFEFQPILEGFNNIIDSFVEPINVMSEYIDRISKGDLPPHITDDYKGDFKEVKTNVNQLIDNFSEFIKEITTITNKHTSGEIDYKINSSKYYGAYKEMVDGVNNVVFFHVNAILHMLDIIKDYADGDLSKKIDRFPGKAAIAHERIDLIRENLLNLIKETDKVVQYAEKDDYSVRGKAENFKGGYQEIVNGFNKFIEIVVKNQKTVEKVAKYNEIEVKRLSNNLKLISKGSFEIDKNIQLSDKDTDKEYKNFENIYQNLDGMKNSIEDIIKGVQNYVEKTKEGKVDEIKFNQNRYQGVYKEIVLGLQEAAYKTSEPIEAVLSVLNLMAKKDFTINMDGDFKGKFKQLQNSLNRSVKSVSETLSQVLTSSDQVNSGSRQVADSSQSLSQGATEQASSLTEISTVIQEISNQTVKNAEHASEADQLSLKSKESAEIGDQKMNELKNAMEEISKSSKEISKIIKVIDEIAFQTNLLALNAAVEAARAGEHGKGFAVVAEEVRELASRSAEAAKETEVMIENALNKVSDGNKFVVETAQSLKEIKDGAEDVQKIVSNIASASNEQAAAISEITLSVKQVEQVTQQVTANAEQSAAASEELSGQAAELKRVISRFKITKNYNNFDYSTPDYDDQYENNVITPSDIIPLDGDDFGKY